VLLVVLWEDEKSRNRDWSKMEDDISRLISPKLWFFPHRCQFAAACKDWYRITKEVHGPSRETYVWMLLPYDNVKETCTLVLKLSHSSYLSSVANGYKGAVRVGSPRQTVSSKLRPCRTPLPDPIFDCPKQQRRDKWWSKWIDGYLQGQKCRTHFFHHWWEMVIWPSLSYQRILSGPKIAWSLLSWHTAIDCLSVG